MASQPIESKETTADGERSKAKKQELVAKKTMSKKRGLSLEEKQQRMLSIFHETADFYQLKDIEKLSVAKGITAQSVKDVLQSLVDDDLVNSDKIGTSNYFWSLPSEAGNKLQMRSTQLESRAEALSRKKEELESKLEEACRGKEDSEERTKQMEQLAQLQKENKELKSTLQQYKDDDPSTFEALKDATQKARNAANRWTDNIWNVESWCNKKFVGNEAELSKHFRACGVPEDLDYLV